MMSLGQDAATAEMGAGQYDYTPSTLFVRTLAWVLVAGTFAFLINNYLNFWWDWPGVMAALEGGEGTALGAVQLLIYALAVAVPVFYVSRSKSISLRRDSDKIYRLVNYLIRGAFWMVVIVGLADMVISFLRVEGLLSVVFGEQLAGDLGRSRFRGQYVHVPLILVAFVVAAFTRTLGFTWLALLVVVAELMIVITRFIFSYEQAFMGDLVRFWYAGLFLFASAYTLIEEGHVRVDVLYAGFDQRTKGLVNAVGSLLLGVSLCFVILWLGMGNKSSIINAPILAYEVTQQGFGMYVKYLMAGFLAIFATSMLIQFAGFFVEGIADYRGDPGKRKVASPSGH